MLGLSLHIRRPRLNHWVRAFMSHHFRYNDFLLGLAHVAKDIDMTYDEVVAHVIKTRHPHPSHRDVTFGATRPNGAVRERTLEEFEGAMEAWGQEHAQHIVFVQGAHEVLALRCTDACSHGCTVRLVDTAPDSILLRILCSSVGLTAELRIDEMLVAGDDTYTTGLIACDAIYSLFHVFK